MDQPPRWDWTNLGGPRWDAVKYLILLCYSYSVPTSPT
jgi:hypothetical protein